VTRRLGIPEILALLPHRYPMLLVDRIESVEPGRRAEGVKCVTANEPFLVGHFPGHPIMPGVLIVDALAQLAGIMMRSGATPVREGSGEAGAGHGVLASINKMRFVQPVFPGDRLVLRVAHRKSLGRVHQVGVEALVDGQTAAVGELTIAS
jgi:3-hydroxyacyl-[acyl-carrier-protein] dehydratase